MDVVHYYLYLIYQNGIQWNTNFVDDMSYTFLDVVQYYIYLIYQNGILIMLLI